MISYLPSHVNFEIKPILLTLLNRKQQQKHNWHRFLAWLLSQITRLKRSCVMSAIHLVMRPQHSASLLPLELHCGLIWLWDHNTLQACFHWNCIAVSSGYETTTLCKPAFVGNVLWSHLVMRPQHSGSLILPSFIIVAVTNVYWALYTNTTHGPDTLHNH